MTSPKNFTVAVVGGGIGGVCVTLGLLRRGVDVHIYEKAAVFGEYGAGLGIARSAVKAMQICDPVIYDAFEQVALKPSPAGRPDVFLEIMDGTVGLKEAKGFVQKWDGIAAGAHRGEFLEGMVKHLPERVCHLNKNLLRVEEDDANDGPCTLHFADGTTATADVVIGFDGIGSHVRHHLVGEDHPATRVKYSHQYIYRMVAPIERAIEALGQERAMTNSLYMAHGKSIAYLVVSGGKLASFSLKRADESDWPSTHKMILPAHKADMLRDAEGLAPDFIRLLENAHEDIDRWALYDLAENLPPVYAQGRICIAGDAAHATTPHLGMGAGLAIEDAAVLAEILADDRISSGSRTQLEAALRAYQAVRMPRGHWLPQASRHNGDLLIYNDPTCGSDINAIEKEFTAAEKIAWGFDMQENVRQAKEELGRQLAAA